MGMKHIIAFRSFAMAPRKWPFALIVGLHSALIGLLCVSVLFSPVVDRLCFVATL